MSDFGTASALQDEWVQGLVEKGNLPIEKALKLTPDASVLLRNKSVQQQVDEGQLSVEQVFAISDKEEDYNLFLEGIRALVRETEQPLSLGRFFSMEPPKEFRTSERVGLVDLINLRGPKRTP